MALVFLGVDFVLPVEAFELEKALILMAFHFLQQLPSEAHKSLGERLLVEELLELGLLVLPGALAAASEILSHLEEASLASAGVFLLLGGFVLAADKHPVVAALLELVLFQVVAALELLSVVFALEAELEVADSIVVGRQALSDCHSN